MSSRFEVTKLLKPMRRKGEAISTGTLNAQINAMIKATCLIEDEDSRIQFMKRVQVMQRDLHCICSEVESHMPRSIKRSSTPNIDLSLHLIGSSDEGYIPLTLWQNVMDITQRIDRLSEGLALVAQRHNLHMQASRSNEDLHLHSDYPSDPDTCVQDIVPQTPYSGDTAKLDSNYSVGYSQSNSDGSQVRTFFSHTRHYYSSDFQGEQDNQLNQRPHYPNMTMNHYYRSMTSSSSQMETTRNHSHRYFTDHPRRSSVNLTYFPEGRHFHYDGPSSQSSNMPQPGPLPWRIPYDIPRFGENYSLIQYPGEESSNLHNFSHYNPGY